MAKGTARRTSPETDASPELAVALEKICYVIIKAREFDVKEAQTDPNSGSNPPDDRMISVLEDTADDPVEEELTSFVSALSEDEQVDLVALTWLGRDDSSVADWPAIREEAARAHRSRPNHTANYLLGEPLLADYLEEGLAVLGRSCGEFEIN